MEYTDKIETKMIKAIHWNLNTKYNSSTEANTVAQIVKTKQKKKKVWYLVIHNVSKEFKLISFFFFFSSVSTDSPDSSSSHHSENIKNAVHSGLLAVLCPPCTYCNFS